MDRSQILRATAFVLLLLSFFVSLPGADAIGVNYGMMGNNLPTPEQVVSLYKSRNIANMRLFYPDSNVLNALKNSGLGVVLGTFTDDLQKLATSPSFAAEWVNTNVVPFASSVNFRYITAGNEVIPGGSASSVLPAIKNLVAALGNANLKIPVTTAVATNVLAESSPPSNGVFGSLSVMSPLVEYLQANSVPLHVNVYPYIAYADNFPSIRLDYALFTANGVVVQDGQLGYSSLFDAIVDATYSALEKAGGPNVEVVVSESGWPSGGGATGATIENAKTYNNNLIAHVQKNVGTPKKPGKNIETYVFAMFNENQKPAGTEQHFGLFNPDMTEVYQVNFTP
ncbi:putative glucan endo-1,3-beta-glucosidase GVI [Iris pallida]|uniref:Glucan endo-1,3-beta-glucosidase GVI n=1 Tax=Iris pallida TaxID=29817 RepID=A0AAX6F8T5_IRIPA|nr:putative glucan endo-1,3-beta-glucosidase GVI [Iris pallida]KAJ6823751.1 putative glucan endo-1,3-beta-glucosidase GVI [Iris pallida]